MTAKTLLLAGGSGFVGSYLTDFFLAKGYTLHILTRRVNQSKGSGSNLKYFHWDPSKKIIDLDAFQHVSVILNLTGANIGEKRWSAQRKREIITSRTESTRLLFETVRDNRISIDTVLSSSAVGYYGMVSSSDVMTESSPAGNDFLAEVCQAWEDQAKRFESIGSRVVILRKGIIIGKGGAYERLAALARWCIHTSLGSGRQYIPWIDVFDLARLYEFLIHQPHTQGVYNAVADEQVTMKEMARALAHSLRKPILTPPAPAFVLRLLLGEMAGMLLEGSPVSNGKLRKENFEFKVARIAETFNSLAYK